MTDVSGMLINLSQLQDELVGGGVAIDHGLILDGASAEQTTPGDLRQPPGATLYAADSEGKPIDLPVAAQPIVAVHVAMRDKTDAEYATEFQNPETTAARKQEIRDITAGLLSREQVPMS